jgi:hypothetical protein
MTKQFIAIVHDADGAYPVTMTEGELSKRIDMADCDDLNISKILYVQPDGTMSRCRIGEQDRAPDFSESNSIVFAYSPVIAAGKEVATIAWTNH